MTTALLSQLDPGDDINSRGDGARLDGIDGLANSIAKLGMFHPLLVKPEGDRFRVIDGNRRLAALRSLGLASDEPIAVVVREDDDSNARVVSLAANVERIQLHPADEYEAFAKIAAEGKTVADIADLFGISERRVQQRLALGNVIPELRDLYRQGQIRADDMKTVANAGPSLQRKVYDQGLRGWQMLEALRPPRDGILRNDSDLAKFVGRETYAGADGAFVTDLFIEEDEQHWANPEIAMGLACEKADRMCEQFIADGWSFAHRTERYLYTNETPEGEVDKKKFTDKDAFKQWKMLMKAIETQPDSNELDNWWAEACEIEQEFDARDWSAEQKASLGVVIGIDWEPVFGVKPTVENVGAPDANEEPAAPVEPVAKEDAPLAASLTADLEMHLTRAMQAGIARNPRFALLLMVDQLHMLLFHARSLSLSFTDYRGTNNKASRGELDFVVAVAQEAGVGKAKTFAGRMRAWSTVEDAKIDRIAAHYIAQSLTNQQVGSELRGYMDSRGFINLTETWLPTVEDFFGRLTKPQLMKLAKDRGIEVMETMKKGALAEAVRAGLPVDWLPKEILG